MALLDATRPAEGEVIRGTERFGKTKRVIGVPSPAAPVLNVHFRPNYLPNYETPRFRLTPRHFAWRKR